MPAWIAGEKGRNTQQRATDLLNDLGLGHRLDHNPAELSEESSNGLLWPGVDESPKGLARR